MRYAADLETTTDPEDCRPWVWGIVDIDDPSSFHYGTDLADLFQLFEKKSGTLYFHNLRFDGEFILYWLFRNGFQYVPTRTDLEPRTFTTIISDMGQWYAIKVCMSRGRKRVAYCTILDSLKVLPFSVAEIARAFKLPIQKGNLSYGLQRPLGHVPTPDELNYLRNDCEIVARALGALFAQELDAMTTGANALRDYRRMIGDYQFRDTFPPPYYDADIRQAYRGGFTYLNPKHRNRIVRGGIVLDVNSLYPYVMREMPLPNGEGIWFDGQYQPDPVYPLYVQMLTCRFSIKPAHIPTIQLKNTLQFNPVEYLTTTGDDTATLCLTSVDLALLFDHYDVQDVQYHSGWKFKSATGLFSDYIDKWSAIKIDAKLEGNAGLYTIAKLMLNSLYGKLAVNPSVRSKAPVYDPATDMLRLALTAPEKRTPIYIPAGAFITAYARNVTIRAAQSVYPRFIYADTDSLHLTGTELPEGLRIDRSQLGAWKHELTFTRAKYLRAKTYVEIGHDPEKDEPDTLRVTCAGLPDSCHDQVTLKNFRPGAIYHGKLLPRHVRGGIVLEPNDYAIRDIIPF